MIPTCPELANLDLLVSDHADPEAVERLLAHIDTCPACLAQVENRNKLYTASSLEPAKTESSPGTKAPFEHFKLSPGVSQQQTIGRFRIVRKLGEGGMGQVYECLDEKLNRRVAVKWIKTAHLSPAFLQSLEKEARIHARLNHPNIVSLLEFGITEGMPFLVMELVDGGTLRTIIRDQKIGPMDTAVIMAEVARGIQAAHDQGVLHRDLKPANILLKAVPNASELKADKATLASLCVPKVTDFGLAKALDILSEDSDSVHLKGTPFYMAPEMFLGASRVIGPGADIYSLGVILYELLTGRVPFAGKNLGEVSELIQNQNPIPPRDFQADVPLDLQTICLKCLEKLPVLRYGSAAELAQDLERFIQNRPIHARPVGALGKAWRWGRRNRLAALLAGVAGVLLSLLVISSVLFAYRQAQLRRVADNLRLQAQAGEDAVKRNYALIRDKYFRELTTATENYNGLRQIVDQGTHPDQVREFFAAITRQRFDRALEMIRRPELLADDSEQMVEAFYLAALQTQVDNQDGAMLLFETAVSRAKAFAAKGRLGALGRFCAMNSDNFQGVIYNQRGQTEAARGVFQDAWDHFRLKPSEPIKDPRLKKFSILVGENLIDALQALGQHQAADLIRAQLAEVEAIETEPLR